MSNLIKMVQAFKEEKSKSLKAIQENTIKEGKEINDPSVTQVRVGMD